MDTLFDYLTTPVPLRSINQRLKKACENCLGEDRRRISPPLDRDATQPCILARTTLLTWEGIQQRIAPWPMLALSL